MEVVIRDYLYKNCDFLNKVLFLNENRRAAAQIQWQNNNDIYANLVIIKSLKFREDSAFIIDKVYKNIQRIKYDIFLDKIKQDKDIKSLSYFTYAIYIEKNCQYYKFNDIWKSL